MSSARETVSAAVAAGASRYLDTGLQLVKATVGSAGSLIGMSRGGVEVANWLRASLTGGGGTFTHQVVKRRQCVRLAGGQVTRSLDAAVTLLQDRPPAALGTFIEADLFQAWRLLAMMSVSANAAAAEDCGLVVMCQRSRGLDPPAAPVAALAGVAGVITNGTHSWKVTFVTSGGETVGSVASNVINVVNNAVNGQVDVTLPIGPAGTTQRKIYRTTAGDVQPWRLVGTVADNVAVTFRDNIADAGVGANVPTVNTSAMNASGISMMGTPAADGFGVVLGAAGDWRWRVKKGGGAGVFTEDISLGIADPTEWNLFELRLFSATEDAEASVSVYVNEQQIIAPRTFAVGSVMPRLDATSIAFVAALKNFAFATHSLNVAGLRMITGPNEPGTF